MHSGPGKRQSNMELLRIVAMFCIVVFHCSFKSGFTFDQLNFNTATIKGFWLLGELGVNLFTLVSGYFLINGKFKGEKLIGLFFQVLFYWWLATFVAMGVGVEVFGDARRTFLWFFPTVTGRYWYFTAYVIIYALSPWINQFLKGLDRTRFVNLLLVVLLIWCVIPTFFGMVNNAVESMLFYSRLVWLIIVYAIGAYIRLASPRWLRGIGRCAAVSALSLAMMVASILLIASHPALFARIGITEWAYFWPPNTVLMLVLSVAMFGVFLNLRVGYSRPINVIASTTLGVYLLHDGILQNFIWGTVVNAARFQDQPFLILYILLAAVVVFGVGVAVDLVRQFVQRMTLGKLFASGPWATVKLRACAAASRLIEHIAEK